MGGWQGHGGSKHLPPRIAAEAKLPLTGSGYPQRVPPPWARRRGIEPLTIPADSPASGTILGGTLSSESWMRPALREADKMRNEVKGLHVREQAGTGQHGVRRTPLLGMDGDDGVELGMVGSAPFCV